MKKTLLLLLILVYVSTTGCSGLSPAPEPSFCRVVTAVSIRTENTPEPITWSYSQPGKTERTLYYLRNINSRDRLTTDPAAIEGIRYHITVHFSDKSEKHYKQIGWEYFMDANGEWMVIPHERGVGLALLLAAIPSDAI